MGRGGKVISDAWHLVPPVSSIPGAGGDSYIKRKALPVGKFEKNL